MHGTFAYNDTGTIPEHPANCKERRGYFGPEAFSAYATSSVNGDFAIGYMQYQPAPLQNIWVSVVFVDGLR